MKPPVWHRAVNWFPAFCLPLALGLGWMLAAGTALAAPKKIVILAGALDDHPPGTHEYEKSALLLRHALSTSPSFAEPAQVEVHFQGWPEDATTLDDADSLLFITGGSDRRETDHPLFAGDHLDVIDRQMKRGCGLMLLHWSTFAPLKTKARLLDWIGGFFDYESGPAPSHWYSAIETKEWRTLPQTAGHPATRGVVPFSLREEYYYRIRFADDDARRVPFLSISAPNESAPEGPVDWSKVVAWGVERADGGRGAGFTGGHFYAHWEIPAFRKFVLNTLAWTAKLDVPDSGVESTTLPLAETRGAEAWAATAPLEPTRHPYRGHFVNRDRLYDFYAKQADYFSHWGNVTDLLLPEFPGLDGPTFGHWGNQTEDTWRGDRWNATDHGSVVSNVFRGANMTIPKAVAVRLGDTGALATVFNPQTLTFDAVWRNGFVRFSDVRQGMMDGMALDGEVLAATRAAKPPVAFRYHGFYRHGKRTVFAYRVGERELLDAAWEENGRFVRRLEARDEAGADSAVASLLQGGPAQWPQVLETTGAPGAATDSEDGVIDTLTLPFDNPWRSLLFLAGHDFFSDGRAAVCTIMGEVWTVAGIDDSLSRLRWKRFATGLHQPLGLKIIDDVVHVLGRDQITALRDLNGDGEADFHQCVTNAYETSPGGHDFNTGLERDAEGAWYFASATQGFARISRDGQRVETLATGFRNANGIAVGAPGEWLSSGQEGEWTPASTLIQVERGGHYGYGGPKNNQPPSPALLYLPRGVDNSIGGSCFIDDAAGPRWAPWRGYPISLSTGTGRALLVLRQQVGEVTQGCAFVLPGEFRSGVQRARFSPHDGHLYVTGSGGWGTYTPDDGCFERLRLTRDPLWPVAWEARDNGVLLRFPRPVDAAQAASPQNHFAQIWNYRYSSAYGSPEFSVKHPEHPGHDALAIHSVQVLDDGRAVFLEIPQLRPVHQLHLRLRVGGPRPLDLFATVHALSEPFTAFPGYAKIAKEAWAGDALTASVTLTTPATKANPWAEGEPGRAVTLEAGLGLQFTTRRLHAAAGERLTLTMKNPDLVPHNFVLLRPGALQPIGEKINQLISHPHAAARHYVPDSPDVLVWTDMIPPRQEFTIHFHAPATPGEYPYLCSFPGHWQIMHGVLVVE